MFKQIVTPTNNQLLIQLPDELVGHQIEVIAFNVENRGNSSPEKISFKERATRLFQFISNNPITLPKGYKFDRDELYE